MFYRFITLLEPSLIEEAIGQAGVTFDSCCAVHAPEAVVQFGEKFPMEFRQFVKMRLVGKYHSAVVEKAIVHCALQKITTPVRNAAMEILDESDSFLMCLYGQVCWLGKVDRQITFDMLLPKKGPIN